MQPFMVAYLEAMIFVNPFLYLEEMQGRLRADLTLLPHEVPSVPVIRDLKIQDGREDDGAPKDGKDWA